MTEMHRFRKNEICTVSVKMGYLLKYPRAQANLSYIARIARHPVPQR